MILLNEKKISFLIFFFTLNIHKILGAHYTILTSTHNQCFKAKLNVKNMQKNRNLSNQTPNPALKTKKGNN